MKLIRETMTEESRPVGEREQQFLQKLLLTGFPVDACALWGLIGMSSNLIFAGNWNIQTAEKLQASLSGGISGD